jgi:hypothetical protein
MVLFYSVVMQTRMDFRFRWRVVILAVYSQPNQINSKLYFMLVVKRKAIAESGLKIITDENEITFKYCFR